MRYIIFIFSFFIFSTCFVKAELNNIPKNFYGTWSNDCESLNKERFGFIFGKSGYLYFYKSNSENGNSYENYAVKFTGSRLFKGWNVISTSKFLEEKKLYIKVNNNVLTMSVDPVSNPDNYEFLESVENQETFTKCEKIPTNLILSFGEIISFINSEFSIPCIKNDINDCVFGIFKFLDISKNNALSIPEITRGSKLLISFINLSETYDKEDNAYTSASTFLISPLLAKIILLNYDYDNSEDLTFKELFQDREILIEKKLLDSSGIEFDNDKIRSQIEEIIQSLEIFKNLM